MQEDVSIEECANLLNAVPFFKHTDNRFLRQLSVSTVTHLFDPGEFILHRGDMSREMYCVRKGYVEVKTL